MAPEIQVSMAGEENMKLAEALSERAQIQARLTHLSQRAQNVVRVQEGEDPAEDPAQLIEQAEALHQKLQNLIMRINRTNSATTFSGEQTISDAIAARDNAQRRHIFFSNLADKAAARQDRFTRMEVKFMPAYPVSQLRDRADDAAKEYRHLDLQLQELNWTTELVD